MIEVGIDLQPIKARLIDRMQMLKKVAGAGALDAALRNGLSAVPASFLLPGAEQPDDVDFGMNQVEQIVTAVFGVVLAVESAADVTGEAAMDLLRPVRSALFETLVGWTYSEEFAPFVHAGGQIIAFANGVLFWQDDFATQYQIQQVFQQ